MPTLRIEYTVDRAIDVMSPVGEYHRKNQRFLLLIPVGGKNVAISVEEPSNKTPV